MHAFLLFLQFFGTGFVKEALEEDEEAAEADAAEAGSLALFLEERGRCRG